MKILMITLFVTFYFGTVFGMKRAHEKDKVQEKLKKAKKENYSVDNLIDQLCKARDEDQIVEIFAKANTLPYKSIFYHNAALAVYYKNPTILDSYKAVLLQYIKHRMQSIIIFKKNNFKRNTISIIEYFQYLLSSQEKLHIPNELYLGYACYEAEIENRPKLLTFLKQLDGGANLKSYKEWLKSTEERTHA